jgi:PAS domain S-box-containing protein
MADYRRQLEQTISETNILFRKVLETLPVGLYLADRNGRIISSNPAGHRIWADTKLVGLDRYNEYKAWRADTGERLTDETWALARAIGQGETSLDEVLEIEAFDGTRKVILNSAVPVYDDLQVMLGAFVVIQDITERFRMQRHLEATNTLLNLFVHAASRADYLNQSLELISGWTGADGVGFRVFDAAGNIREEPFRGFDPEFWRLSSPGGGRAGCCSCLEDLLGQREGPGSHWLTPQGSVWIDNLDSESARSLVAGPEKVSCPCLEYGYRGLAIVPIRTPERVAGTLHLVSRETGKPTAQSVQLAESLAPILAEAIQRFEIGEELQQHRDKLEELVQLRTRELEAANDRLRREIVERERMEKELLEMERLRILADSRKEWQETFDAITDLVSIHDSEFVVRKANRAFLDHFGLTPGDVSRHRCYELFHEGDCPIDGCPQCTHVNGAGPASREVADPKTGRVFHVSTYPFHGADGEPGGVIHIARDVTEQKDREIKMILSERLASLGQMAAGIAHEINNPLATIGTCAEGLLRRLTEGREDPALMRDYLGIIEEEVRRCQVITNGMLSFVRQDSGSRALLDVHELIDKTLALVGFQGRLQHVEVVRNFGSAPLRVRANEGGLRQVLLALVVNALDAMGDRGTLTLSTSASDGEVRISVRDSGPGIPPALLHRIFDLFFTTKSARGGTGLGLPIAHKIARENGGDLAVSSTPGQGATFTVIVPAN